MLSQEVRIRKLYSVSQSMIWMGMDLSARRRWSPCSNPASSPAKVWRRRMARMGWRLDWRKLITYLRHYIILNWDNDNLPPFTSYQTNSPSIWKHPIALEKNIPKYIYYSVCYCIIWQNKNHIHVFHKSCLYKFPSHILVQQGYEGSWINLAHPNMVYV